ncbi:MAG TPA: hypothetical protein VF172_03370 [Nitrososphaera sp.]|jgi:hypothetical protein
MEQAIVAVPRGIHDPASGQWIRQVHLRQLVGNDEKFLAELSDMPLHLRVLAFLERVASFEVGETAELLRKLSIGDRVALMLHIRRMELGDTLDCTISCVKCHKGMSVALSAAKLLGTKGLERSLGYDMEVGGFNLTIKPLTALDQNKLLSTTEGEDLLQMLARSCIIGAGQTLPEKLPNEAMEAIGSMLEQIDPLSDIVLDISCPECGHKFSASFNVEDFVLRELRVGQSDIDSEVHWLALHYHWSENEILSLPMRRRRKYISLINSALAGGSV